MKFGRLELSIIKECQFKLDGGAMFGVVPKTLWSKQSKSDDFNRITLSCNLLLIEGPDFKILVETGMGLKWSKQEIDRYEIKTLVNWDNIVEPFALVHEDINAVVISHLHFDHAGGCTKMVQGNLIPTFPNAKHYVQKGEWEFAHNANSRAKASYRLEDFEPILEHGLLELIDGDTEIYPGIWLKLTGGHTKCHQVLSFADSGQKGIFLADIMPTVAHVNPAWVMGYDHFPLTSCDYKNSILKEASDNNYLVVFDHEFNIPWGHVKLNNKGRFEFTPLDESSLKPRSNCSNVI